MAASACRRALAATCGVASAAWASGGLSCEQSGKVRTGRRLAGSTVLVTGANAGIGFETARQAYVRGANVLMACRSIERCDDAKEAIEEDHGDEAGSVEVLQLDLSSVESIRKAADALQGRPIHTLINNAGVMGPPERVPSELQGLERQLAVNHMGHFLLTGLLLPNLRASTPARVINVSSNASDFGNLVMGDLGWDPAKRKFSYWHAYADSKLANVLHARELNRLMAAEGVDVTAYSLHPGSVVTTLHRDVAEHSWLWRVVGDYIVLPLQRPFTQTVLNAANEVLHVAMAKREVRDMGPPPLTSGEEAWSGVVAPGHYHADGRVVRCSARQAYDDAVARDLWAASEEATQWRYAAPK